MTTSRSVSALSREVKLGRRRVPAGGASHRRAPARPMAAIVAAVTAALTGCEGDVVLVGRFHRDATSTTSSSTGDGGAGPSTATSSAAGPSTGTSGGGGFDTGIGGAGAGVGGSGEAGAGGSAPGVGGSGP